MTSAELVREEPDERLVGGRYVVGPVIGKGSSAVVRRGRDVQTGRDVAIKMFRPDRSNADRSRQRREFALLAALDHPALVRLYDGGVDGEDPFVVLDLVEGPTLAQRISCAPVPAGEVRVMGARLADALAHVHAAGIVHRDVKPANVLFGADGAARLTDFGIARAVDSTVATEAGCVVGTAAYLAPEQARGERVAAPADVYALGLLLLEAVKGVREYPGSAVESATARLFRAPVVPDGLPDGMSDLLRAMTAAEPVERPSAAVVAARLTPRPVHRRVARHRRRGPASRRGLLGIAAVALAVSGGATVSVLATGPDVGPVTGPTAIVPDMSPAASLRAGH